MAKLFNIARVTTATTGTGTITLGAAVSGYLTFALAGVANGDVVSYGIKDGANSEVGTGTYTSAGTTLTRTVTKSTNADAAISLSGAAEVYITVRAEDFSLGTTTNDNAAAGYVGESSEASLSSGSALSMTANVDINVISLSLTAGDWDVQGWAWFTQTNAGTVTTVCQAWISTTSATRPTPPASGFQQQQVNYTGGNQHAIATGSKRISLSATTTVYLSARSTFATSTQSVYGYISARRVR